MLEFSDESTSEEGGLWVAELNVPAPLAVMQWCASEPGSSRFPRVTNLKTQSSYGQTVTMREEKDKTHLEASSPSAATVSTGYLPTSGSNLSATQTRARPYPPSNARSRASHTSLTASFADFAPALTASSVSLKAFAFTAC